MSLPVLILTGSFGEGHNTAARNLRQAFDQRGVQSEVFDFLAASYPRISGALSKGYGFAITHLPGIWRLIYRAGETDKSSALAIGAVQRDFTKALRDRAPRAVITTFPVYLPLLDKIYPDPSTRPFHFFTVVTDCITIHPSWFKGSADRIFVTDERSKEIVHAAGIPRDRITASGFPIALREPSVEAALLPPNKTRPRLLYMPTTRRAHVKATLAELAGFCRSQDIDLTIVLGKHAERFGPLVEEIRPTLPEGRLTVHGWIDYVPKLMTEHHVLISKAGGATVNEALGNRCPLIINWVVPGQEEGNATLVQETGTGLRIHEPAELPGVLHRLLLEREGELWNDMRARLKAMDLAQAALRIADAVMEASTHSRGTW